jgi:hypothetical protein
MLGVVPRGTVVQKSRASRRCQISGLFCYEEMVHLPNQKWRFASLVWRGLQAIAGVRLRKSILGTKNSHIGKKLYPPGAAICTF